MTGVEESKNAQSVCINYGRGGRNFLKTLVRSKVLSNGNLTGIIQYSESGNEERLIREEIEMPNIVCN